MSNPLSTPPRRDVRSRPAETLERILAAATALLEREGHQALTMRMVASRAEVSSATTYAYFSSKNHLFAEIFWRLLHDHPSVTTSVTTDVGRLQAVIRDLARLLESHPAVTAAATASLLSSDGDVERLRLQIGAHVVERFRAALHEDTDPALLEPLVLMFSGALLQAGMGLFGYTEMGERLSTGVAAIMKGRP